MIDGIENGDCLWIDFGLDLVVLGVHKNFQVITTDRPSLTIHSQPKLYCADEIVSAPTVLPEQYLLTHSILPIHEFER